MYKSSQPHFLLFLFANLSTIFKGNMFLKIDRRQLEFRRLADYSYLCQKKIYNKYNSRS